MAHQDSSRTLVQIGQAVKRPYLTSGGGTWTRDRPSRGDTARPGTAAPRRAGRQNKAPADIITKLLANNVVGVSCHDDEAEPDLPEG